MKAKDDLDKRQNSKSTKVCVCICVCVRLRIAAATAQLAGEATAACNKLATSTVRTEFNSISILIQSIPVLLGYVAVCSKI